MVLLISQNFCETSDFSQSALPAIHSVSSNPYLHSLLYSQQCMYVYVGVYNHVHLQVFIKASSIQ